MNTILEDFRVKNGLTYEAMAEAAGFSNRSVVQRHAKGRMPISGEAALRYHTAFGIPLPDLRPDLYGDRRPAPAHSDEAAA
ncbi:MAG: helix-turn-helix domain-containing protein [Desulfomicrobium sp.]